MSPKEYLGSIVSPAPLFKGDVLFCVSELIKTDFPQFFINLPSDGLRKSLLLLVGISF